MVAVQAELLDFIASVSQQFPNDQMRVQLVKESRGHTIETLNAQVIKAINQALEKARTAPTVKAYANGINTHQEWNKNGEPDGWEVRGSLVLEGTDTASVAHLAGQLASTLQLDGVSYQLSTARRQAEENNLIQQAANAFRARTGTTSSRAEAGTIPWRAEAGTTRTSGTSGTATTR